jgi:hypothetical protein
VISNLEIARLVGSDHRLLLAHQLITLPCGCRAYVGKLCPALDQKALCSKPCTDDHAPLIARFRALWSDLPPNPRWDSVAVHNALEKAADEFHARETAERMGAA